MRKSKSIGVEVIHTKDIKMVMDVVHMDKDLGGDEKAL